MRFGIGATALLLTDAARAEPVGDADELFREGQRLLGQGKTHEACEIFAESERLEPAMGTLLNLADCHAQEHKAATASAEFLEAAALAGQRGQRERADFARAQVERLEKIMAYVKLDFAANAKIEDVRLDGRVIDRARWSDPIALDPGPHLLSFAARGKAPRSMALTVDPGPGTQRVAVRDLDERRPEGAPSPVGAHDTTRTRQALGLVAGGVGLLGISLGTYFGLRAAGDKSDGDGHCNGRFCDADGLSLQQDAHTEAAISTVAFMVGLAGIGAGLYLTLIPSSTQDAGVRARPLLGAGKGGVGLETDW